GFAWDVFGTGRTAFKASLNRYTQDLSLLANNCCTDAQNYTVSASRTWTDDNHNFAVDCDLFSAAASDLRTVGGDRCAAYTGAAANFGLSVPTSVNDKDTISGWQHRPSNWEFSAEIQQDLIPRRLAVDVAFFRRWYGNFTTTDNFALDSSNYGSFSVVVPAVNPITGKADLPLSG